jgi:hypothetical protein
VFRLEKPQVVETDSGLMLGVVGEAATRLAGTAILQAMTNLAQEAGHLQSSPAEEKAKGAPNPRERAEYEARSVQKLLRTTTGYQLFHPPTLLTHSNSSPLQKEIRRGESGGRTKGPG